MRFNDLASRRYSVRQFTSQTIAGVCLKGRTACTYGCELSATKEEENILLHDG